MHNYNNDDDNRDGNQKGSFWDWLLTLFLIRKSKNKATTEKVSKTLDNKETSTISQVNNNNYQLEEAIQKQVGIEGPIAVPTIIPVIEELQPELTPKFGIEEVQPELTPKADFEGSHQEATSKTLMEMFIAIDNQIKAGNTNDEKVVNLVGDISKLIKKQLNKCKDDLDKIDVKVGEAIKKKDVEKLQKELNDIYNKMVLLRMRIESLRNGEFSNYDLEEDHKLTTKVKALGEYATRDDVLNIMHLCDEKLVSMMELMRVEDKQQGVAESIQIQEGTVVLRDQHFIKSNHKLSLVKDAESILLMAINEQNYEIKRIKEEMAKLEPTTKNIMHLDGVGQMFGNTLKLAFGILSLPLSGTKSKLFGTMLIANSIKGLKKGVTLKDEKIVYYEYSKFNQTINSTVSRLDGIDYMLTNALTDLDDLRIDYVYHFKEYQNVLQEYDEFIKKIEALQQKIIEEREKVQKMVNKINMQKKQDKVLKKEMVA